MIITFVFAFVGGILRALFGKTSCFGGTVYKKHHVIYKMSKLTQRVYFSVLVQYPSDLYT